MPIFFCKNEGYDRIRTILKLWKFYHFSVTQILREINFGDSRSAKSAILTYAKALNFDFDDFLHFLKAEIDQMKKIHRL